METFKDYVPLSANDFTAAVSTVTSTGSTSADLRRRLQAALTSLPEQTNVTALLAQFSRAVAGLVGVGQLQSEAETIATGIGGISNENSNAAAGIANVSHAVCHLNVDAVY